LQTVLFVWKKTPNRSGWILSGAGWARFAVYFHVDHIRKGSRNEGVFTERIFKNGDKSRK
jgi:hypothetical protein